VGGGVVGVVVVVVVVVVGFDEGLNHHTPQSIFHVRQEREEGTAQSTRTRVHDANAVVRSRRRRITI